MTNPSSIISIPHSKTLIILLGPTAIGKTDIAVKLARELNTEIISCDSRQFYKELTIGTARPSLKEMDGIVHHFIGHLSVKDYYNVSMFEQDTLKLLVKLFKKRDMVIMTGGSGMYIDVVCHGIDQLPDADKELRGRIKSEYRTRGIDYIKDRLKKVDPEYYEEVDLSNPKRIMRALEVYEATGKKYSQLRTGTLAERNFNIVKIGLNTSREALFNRINTRVDMMMDKGLLEEVRSLKEYQGLNALNTVGYKELFDYSNEKTDLKTAIEKIKTNTRRYAKRQLTWFKRDNEIHWFEPDDYNSILDLLHHFSFSE